ncbi:hypothetical protein PO239_20945 [Bacteroides ovatus]|uniref:hypothetical protein n=1 Tax=Bacteroides ovatus TaxID=28116 RepID=UPI00189A373F|nr:hypothetical protein [Bacteroides ovatus]MDC2673479.1 hypothetical protein [Bacteroides ovatus]MDC2694034.1 hypothetical protein [Bacteroides ovatus]MDC2698944.1 hypothetical protein [Bacteroides ovatus]MDC2714140.1 hypothetical protein [Bacteroides ovatus]
MRTLQIKQDSLLAAFRNAGKEGKQVLSDLFGKQVALYDNITDRVKSFEDACQVLGISTNVPEVKGLPRKHQKAIIANYKLIVIAEALNEGWKPNWQDSDEYKYYPWFDMSNPAGVGYSPTNHTASNTLAAIGSRLCLKNRELAIYFGQTFTDLFNDSLLLNA